MIPGKINLSDRGIVPEETISKRRIDDRERRLCIPVHEIIGTALTIEVILLLLAQTVNMLVLPRLKDDAGAIVVSLDVRVPRCGIRFLPCAQNLLSIPVKGQDAALVPRVNL